MLQPPASLVGVLKYCTATEGGNHLGKCIFTKIRTN